MGHGSFPGSRDAEGHESTGIPFWLGRDPIPDVASTCSSRAHSPLPPAPLHLWVRGLGLALLLLLATMPAFAIDPMPFADRAEEVRFQNLLRELRCLQCQNQTLADSDADIARQLREEIFRMMNEGQSDAQIKDFLTARYGDFVLYKPPVKSGTWLLWFGPFLILAGAATALVVHLRKRRGVAAAPAANQARDEEDW
ncbi:MAG: cytochrome c-type biogenesis protein CcmH [Xanthomonadales bacterium]|nr:cytochrome c-type biogenesis protein CcmH [Xanthomonadales bacterium]